MRKDMLYGPDIGLTVISVSKIANAGYRVLFEGKPCKIKDPEGKIVGKIPKSTNGLYRVDWPITVAATAQEHIDLITAHRRLGHISVESIRELIRSEAVIGLHLIDLNVQIDCDSCEYAKSTRKIIQKKSEIPRSQAFGDEIHSDLWGPAPISSLGGCKYYVTFTDDHTRFTRLILLKSKDEMLEVYKSFAVWAQTQHGVHLRLDRRGEYMCKAFTKFLKSQGTERRLTTHDTPQHNRVVESLNRRLVEHIHAILYRADLPKSLWEEAAHFTICLKNSIPTNPLGKVTPYQQLYGTKPNLSIVPEWGQRVWVHQSTGSKLDGRAAEGQWVGFD